MTPTTPEEARRLASLLRSEGPGDLSHPESADALDSLAAQLEAAQKVIAAARFIKQGATDRDPTNDSTTEMTGYDYWRLVHALTRYDAARGES